MGYHGSLIQKKGEAPLCSSFDNFYTRRLYHRIQDVFNRPFTGPPGAHINVIERTTKDGIKFHPKEDKKSKNCLNLGSYNYLGFADDWNSTCKDSVMKTFDKYNVGTCSPRAVLGTHKLHKKLEK